MAFILDQDKSEVGRFAQRSYGNVLLHFSEIHCSLSSASRLDWSSDVQLGLIELSFHAFSQSILEIFRMWVLFVGSTLRVRLQISDLEVKLYFNPLC